MVKNFLHMTGATIKLWLVETLNMIHPQTLRVKVGRSLVMVIHVCTMYHIFESMTQNMITTAS